MNRDVAFIDTRWPSKDAYLSKTVKVKPDFPARSKSFTNIVHRNHFFVDQRIPVTGCSFVVPLIDLSITGVYRENILLAK